MRRPGVEPGSTAWKATMLTVTPPTLLKILPLDNLLRSMDRYETCWNCCGVMLATPYLINCLFKCNVDICGISEHHFLLYNSVFLNTIDSNYTAFTKCATERDPAVYRNVNRGGVALLIHKKLIHCTSLLYTDSNRIIGAKWSSAIPQLDMYYVSIYRLPIYLMIYSMNI